MMTVICAMVLMFKEGASEADLFLFLFFLTLTRTIVDDCLVSSSFACFVCWYSTRGVEVEGSESSVC